MGEHRSVRRQAARALRAYGADPARWPGGVDGSLWAAACSEPRLRRLLDAAQRLDAALDASVAEPSAEFLARLTASAPVAGGGAPKTASARTTMERGGFWRALFPAAPAWAPAMAVAFALFAGGMTGVLTAGGGERGVGIDEDEAALVAALSELSFAESDDQWSVIQE